MKCFLAFVVVIVIIVGGFFGYIHSGWFNVAATQDNPGWIDYILVTVRKNSISSRVDQVRMPDNVDLADPKRIAVGAKHYEEMCAVCHLRPGEKNSETRQGLNPQPPDLPRIAKYLEPDEEFWAVKHGIRMTAMPAWGPTHSDRKIWDIVSFLQALPGMTPAQYQKLTVNAAAVEEGE